MYTPLYRFHEAKNLFLLPTRHWSPYVQQRLKRTDLLFFTKIINLKFLSHRELALTGRCQAVMVMVGEIQRRIHRGRPEHGRRRAHELGRRHRVEIGIITGHAPTAMVVAAHRGGHTRHREGWPAVAAARSVQAGRRGEEAAQGLVVVVVSLLLGLGGELAVPGLDVLLLEGGGPRDVVQLVVEAAGVADRLAVGVASPERGGVGAAVGATRALPLSRGLKSEKDNVFKTIYKLLKYRWESFCV